MNAFVTKKYYFLPNFLLLKREMPMLFVNEFFFFLQNIKIKDTFYKFIHTQFAFRNYFIGHVITTSVVWRLAAVC